MLKKSLVACAEIARLARQTQCRNPLLAATSTSPNKRGKKWIISFSLGMSGAARFVLSSQIGLAGWKGAHCG